jgi:apolipoprotein D and lipocalin family protein
MNLIYIVVILVVIFIIYISYPYPSLPTIKHLDLSKYLGLWHEVARLPNFFQSGCFNSTAEYSLTNDNQIKVVNKCYVDDKIVKVEGVAVHHKNEPGVFDVYFGYGFIAGDYNIIYLDPNYQYALVGTKSRSNLWILSRSKTLDKTIISKLSTYANSLGFDTKRLARY